MRTRSLTIALATTAAIATGTGVAVGAAQRVTPTGVGEVRIGKTFAQLRAAHAVGRLRPGCELAGPNTRSARLRAPLKGSIDFTQTSPRRVRNITITGGATARGIRVGSTKAQIRAAFPKARFDHRTEAMFQITLVRVPKNAGGRLQFAVDVRSGKVDSIGIPAIPFCE
jgi:hypothetical protein